MPPSPGIQPTAPGHNRPVPPADLQTRSGSGHSRGRPTIRRVAGFLLVAAVLLLPIWWRANAESTLWIDEIHSLQLVQLPLPRLLDETSRDFHPPGYPLALKAWLKAGRILGLEPGVAWARSLNVGLWGLVAAVTWFVGGTLLGNRGGLLLTLCVAGSSAAAVAVQDVRSYAFAFGFLVIASLLLTLLCATAQPRRRWALLWTAYAAALTGALWSHLLAAPAVALLTLSWAVLVWRAPRAARPRASAAGLLAHAGAWLLFLPWLLRVPAQMAQLQRAAPDWMTPASLENLAKVFAWWLPLGRISPPAPAAEPWLLLLGGLACALPIAVGLRARSAPPVREAARTLALLALPAATGSVLLYWLLARLGIAATFHGPRYPMIVAGLFAAGLVGAALHGTRRARTAALVLAPWLISAVIGHTLALRQEAAPGGLTAFRPQVDELAADLERGTLYISPSELAPFVRRTFPELELRPVEDLVCSSPRRALVLDVNPWTNLDRARDVVLRRVIKTGRLAPRVERRDWVDLQTSATLYRLDDIDAVVARSLCETGLSPRSAIPADAVSSARPEDQLAGDGWSYLELDDDLRARRWARVPGARLLFDRRVPAGGYVLHIVGVRLPYPEEVVVVGVDSADRALDVETPLPPGPFELTLPMTLERSRRPVLRLRHPVWSPAEATGSNDRRQLSILFEGAWLAKVDG